MDYNKWQNEDIKVNSRPPIQVRKRILIEKCLRPECAAFSFVLKGNSIRGFLRGTLLDPSPVCPSSFCLLSILCKSFVFLLVKFLFLSFCGSQAICLTLSHCFLIYLFIFSLRLTSPIRCLLSYISPFLLIYLCVFLFPFLRLFLFHPRSVCQPFPPLLVILIIFWGSLSCIFLLCSCFLCCSFLCLSNY